jgi:predicted lipoprotein with Yx(FWY)xxD motif
VKRNFSFSFPFPLPLVILLAVVLAASATVSALAGARPALPARGATFHTVELRKTKLGKILVNSAGSILYEFSRDHGKQNSCVKISGCQEVWPALAVQGKPSAGSGVSASLLSTIKLSNGSTQVTYAGHPLYIYATEPTATSYVGVKQFGGAWYALNAKGQAVK